MPLSDEDFQRRLADGRRFENYVAEVLNGRGVSAVVPGEELGSKDEYARLDTDIVVGSRVIEVKSRAETCVFTGPDDFPFGDIFLDTESGWNKKERKPDYYVVVSQQTGGILVVPGSTRDQWSCRSVWDKTCGYASPTLVADKKLAQPLEWLIDDLKDS